jgi:hypothetical protein
MSARDQAENGIRALAAKRHLPDAHLARWLAMEEGSRTAILAVAEQLRLRTGQLVTALELLEEIAVREGETPEATLARTEITRAINLAGSTPARAAAFLEALRTVRFPRLGRTMARLREELAGLGLPAGLSVVLPKDLNADAIVIRLDARTGDELRRLIAALNQKEAGLIRLLGILGGENEV